ncbi:glycosyltransferase family 25 protein [Pseudidiomarina insulisalsae]|uniref:glycosyltransferase family 25 protein n=1 Tax=Pseudidiomarina insulisalsae TaxID=575789 RepID=UPI00130060BF|nr:glycosyltransferase family 25 protein [Pseudidiomarina insulisalsae]
MADLKKWKVLVINLERSPERWRNVKAQLEATGLPFERIDAVAGDTLGETAIARVFDSDAARNNYHYQLSRGEIGCYLSHLKAWQTILDEQLDYAIVLEDDVVLDPKFSSLPEAVAQCSESWDLIKVAAPFKQQKSYLLDNFAGFRWVRFKKPPMGACGHIVSAAGAKKLLAQRPPFHRPVDVDLQWQTELGLVVRGLMPFAVDNTHQHGSDIFAMGDRRKQPRRPLVRVKHQLLLYLDSLRARW